MGLDSREQQSQGQRTMNEKSPETLYVPRVCFVKVDRVGVECECGVAKQ